MRAAGPARRRPTVPAFGKPIGSHCESCVLRDAGHGYVPATGSPGPILFVGEAPGYDEATVGAPMVGMAGSMLQRVLRLEGHLREEYRIDNAVRCVPPDFNIHRFPTAVESCRYLDETLAEGPKVVVALGGTATKRLLGYPHGMKEFSIEDFHGTVHRDRADRFWIVPTFHPSYLQRGATNLMGVTAFDIRRAHEVAAGGWAADPGELWLDPPLDWFRLWAEGYIAAVARDGPWAYPLAVDIETPEKGTNEGDLIGSVSDATYQILRVNLSCHPDEGITVPYVGEYIPVIDQVLRAGGVKYFWYKHYDEPRLRAAGHVWDPLLSLDMMWAAKALQSDLPQGLGFWAPFYSRWGAWKHLAKGVDAHPVRYAAIDGLQTRRVGDGILSDLHAQGRMDVFWRQMHRFHAIVLQPATDVGVPIDRPRLVAFKAKLDVEASRLLGAIADRVPEGLCPLVPKGGLKLPPKPGVAYTKARATTAKGEAKKDAPDPLKMALYARATLVERIILAKVQRCATCGTIEVAKTHRCQPALIEGIEDARPILEEVVASVRRWFWQEPFNPDSPDQLMAYARANKHEPGKSKATGEDSMDRETLHRLVRETEDPLYSDVLAYRAVAKVRGTYVVGTEKRLDDEDRLHGTFGFKPSTMRLNGSNPNLQNVVADKGGKDGLAAGFRSVIVARGRWVEAGSGWEDATEDVT